MSDRRRRSSSSTRDGVNNSDSEYQVPPNSPIGLTAVKQKVQNEWETRLDEVDSSMWAVVTRNRCRKCEQLDPKIFGPLDKGTSHHLYENLRKAASDGCELCKVLAGGLDPALGTAEMRFDEEKSILNYYFRRHKIYRASKVSKTFDIFREEASTSEPTPSFRPIASHPNHKRCYSLVQRWIENCISSHPTCKQLATYRLPTRILEVSKGKVRLYTEELYDKPYITLSYCWGQKRQLMTTTRNINDHKAGLPSTELPKTFRDAIEVTRNLGAQYLWIDALCIMQDSDSDKAAECARMGSYYRNSYLTISALSAPNSSTGFLKRRPFVPEAQLFVRQSLRIRPKTATRASIFRASPLSQRGWTLQERLLSTRVLHYSTTELFWECLTCTCREGSTIEHSGNENTRDLATSEGEDFKRVSFNDTIDPTDPNFGAFALWYRLIRQFSRRSLTYQDDALPAVSGLASSMASKLQLQYIAGLWAEDLNSLLWQVDPETFLAVRTANLEKRVSGVPTWSWASLAKPVIYPFTHEDRQPASAFSAHFLTSTLQTEAGNALGKVSRGSITLFAPFIPNVRCTLNMDPIKRKHPLAFDSVDRMRLEVYAKWEGDEKVLHGFGYFDEWASYDVVYLDENVIGGLEDRSWAKMGRKAAAAILKETMPCALVGIAERVNPSHMSPGGDRSAVVKWYFLIVVQAAVEQEGEIDVEQGGNSGVGWKRIGLGWTTNPSFFAGCDKVEVRLV